RPGNSKKIIHDMQRRVDACFIRYPLISPRMHYFATMRYARASDDRDTEPKFIYREIVEVTRKKIDFERSQFDSSRLYETICSFIQPRLLSGHRPEAIGINEVSLVFAELEDRVSKLPAAKTVPCGDRYHD